MSKRFEGFFQSFDDHQFFYQYWAPPKSKGVLIITHGHGEHSGSYHRVVEALAPLSLTVYAWDLRGHGRSEGQRGFANEFNDFSRDFEAFFNHLCVQHQIQNEKIFLLAHSMGGLIQSLTLMDHPEWPIQAQVLSSPLFGLALEVPLIKDLAAVAMSKVFPQLTMGNQIKNEDVSRDQKVHEEFDRDVLRHNRMSPNVYLGTLVSFQRISLEFFKISLPTLIQISNQDPVVSTEAVQRLFQKYPLTNCELKIYPDRKHETYNDLGREEVLKDLVDFLSRRITA